MTAHDRFVEFLDGFIPEILDEDPRKRHLSRSRARALVVVLGASIVLPFVALMALLLLHLLTGQDFSIGLGLALGAMVILVIQHMLFQSTGKLFITAVAYSVTYFIFAIAGTFFTGGLESPVILLLFCSPLVTYLISGYRYAIYSVVVVYFTAVVFIYMELHGITTPQIMHIENRPYVRGLVWLIASCLMFLLFFIQRSLLDRRRSQ